jgi:hypothetical protein
MRTTTRTIILLAALGCTSCSRLSNNAGKIEGKWRLVSCSAATEAENAALADGRLALFFEFTGDGKVRVTAEAPGLSTQAISGRYSLLAEDFVEFSDFPEQKRRSGGFLGPLNAKDGVRATISGDDMTMMSMDLTNKFRRVK